MPKYSLITIFASFMLTSIATYAECRATTSVEIADKIANGHAWMNHGSEFSEKKVIANLPMPQTLKVTTTEDFKAYILSVMTTVSSKSIASNRQVYWDALTGTIIFYDPLSNDCGTAFRPNDGKKYYERVLKRKESDKDRSKIDAHLKRTFEQHKNQTNRTPQVREESDFQCDGRTHCSHMKSCAEATFFLNNCPNTKMDGNNDGIPCERQWCN